MNTTLFSFIGRALGIAVLFSVGFFGTLALMPKKETVELPPATTGAENPTTIAPPFTLEPPSLALRAVLATSAGEVLHKTRDAGEYVPATPSGEIVLGESIATGLDGKATISIPSLVSIDMGKTAELVFANVFKENTVLQQKAGEITYRIESGVFPVAIRALRALVSAKNAAISITIKDTDVSVTVLKGEAKVGLVDSENTTHVYTVKEGSRAAIDNYSQSVRIVSPR